MTTVLEALREGLRSCLAESNSVHLIGEDVLDPYGGAFKVTQGLSTEFPDRVLTTPVSESGIVGLGVGMAMRGLRPIVEIMFGDFITLAADQLINHAAKMRWMSQDRVQVPLVVRTPMGGGRGYGPTHSQTLEKHFLGAPGLRVVAASDLENAGELLTNAVLQDDDPVLFIEHKLLYSVPVHGGDEIREFIIKTEKKRYPTYRVTLAGAPSPGMTLVAYGYMAHLARKAVLQLAYNHELFVELIVPTQLGPVDIQPMVKSVQITGKLLTLEEGTKTMGWGAEIVAQVSEKLGPSVQTSRIAALDMPVPSAGTLETIVLPNTDRIVREALEFADQAHG